jgi:hypothetical protein
MVGIGRREEKRVDGLLVDANIPFIDHRVQLSTLAANHRLPAIYPWPFAVPHESAFGPNPDLPRCPLFRRSQSMSGHDADIA